MTNPANSPVILNLGGALPSALVAYLESRNIPVFTESDFDSQKTYTHIITANLSNFSEINDIYQTVAKNIKILSLTDVHDLQNFMSANGRLVLDHAWLEGNLGTFILDKLFQEYAGIAIGDNYPSFKELGSFNITNPFSTGEYLDHMVFQAFESGLNALSIKTYFDHLLTYLTQLKAQNKVGMPLEVSYGSFDGVFGLQIHFFAADLNIDDVTNTLSAANEHIHHNPLRIAMNSCEFFDFTSLKEVQKVVVTALWSNQASHLSRNGGLLFSHLDQPGTMNHFPSEGLSPFFTQQEDIPDLSYKLASLPQEDEAEEEFTQTIKGTKEVAFAPIVISGSKPEAEAKQVVSGGKQEAESATLVKGQKTTADNSVQRISGGAGDDSKGEMRVKSLGNMPGRDPGQNVNMSNEATLRKELEKLQIENNRLAKVADGFRKQLSDKISENSTKDEAGIRTEIAKALAEKDKQVESTLGRAAKENDLLKSKMMTLGNELKVLRESQNKSASIRTQALKAIEEKLPSDLKGLETPEAKMRKLELEFEQKVEIYRQELEKSQRQSLSKDTLLTKLRDTMNASLKKRDQDVQELQTRLNAQTLKSASNEFADMEFKDFSGPKTKSGSSDKELNLEGQLSKVTRENELLKARLSVLASEIQSSRDELKSTKEDMSQGSSVQKNISFHQDSEKLERELVAKELMLTKARENFNKALEKRDVEIRGLQERINQMLQKDANPAVAQQLIHMEKQNQNLSKMNETFKSRISALVAELESFKAPDSKDDNKRLQMTVAQNKNTIDTLKKDVTRMQEKASADNGLIMNLKNEKSKLEQLLKKTSLNAKVDQVTVNLDQELKKYQSQNTAMEIQLKDASAKVKELETKLQDSSKNQKAQTVMEDGQSKIKISHLETSLKKLTQDLIADRNQLSEAKKELNKLRLEKTSLQNQVDKYKKDAEKNKPAAPKKPNSGGKAA